jgi:beta-lactamase regulating signal transducer with metallopeptidase domain
MSLAEQLLCGWAANLLWQPFAVYILARCIAARTGPGIAHAVWITATFSAVAGPLGVMGILYGAPSMAANANGSETLFAWAGIAALAFAFASMFAGAARLIWDSLALRKLRRAARPVTILDDSSGITVLVSPAQIGPLTCGIYRPVILLPEFLFGRSCGPAMDMALVHEQAHVTRRDHWWLAITELMLVPLALHPVGYWLRHRLSESREQACDERVLNTGANAGEYARALLTVAASIRETAPAAALGATSSMTLSSRIHAILRRMDSQVAIADSRTAVLIACLLTATLFGGTFAAAAHAFSRWNPLPVPHHAHAGPKPPPPPRR